MLKKKRTSFYVMVKNFNNGKVEPYDVMPSLYGGIFNQNGKLSKSRFFIYDSNWKRKEITTIKDLRKYIDLHFMYCYRGKCEWEFIVSNWPPCEGSEVKIDAYEQLKPNIDLITSIVWDQIKDKILK